MIQSPRHPEQREGSLLVNYPRKLKLQALPGPNLQSLALLQDDAGSNGVTPSLSKSVSEAPIFRPLYPLGSGHQRAFLSSFSRIP
jgi:hypothetical protein